MLSLVCSTMTSVLRATTTLRSHSCGLHVNSPAIQTWSLSPCQLLLLRKLKWIQQWQANMSRNFRLIILVVDAMVHLIFYPYKFMLLVIFIGIKAFLGLHTVSVRVLCNGCLVCSLSVPHQILKTKRYMHGISSPFIGNWSRQARI